MSALVRAQPGDSASVTTTLVRVESPSLITWIVKVAVCPLTIVCVSGDFRIVTCGLITSTSAESSAVTSCSVSSVPVATAVLVKSEVTLASEQSYETLSPGAKVRRDQCDLGRRPCAARRLGVVDVDVGQGRIARVGDRDRPGRGVTVSDRL